jgi:hypothetical protein
MNNNITTQQYIGYILASILSVGSLYFIFFKYDLGYFGICIAFASVIISVVGFPSGTKKL